MKTVDITADIYSTSINMPYRLFIDDTLMTERTFVWPTKKTYIEENMIIEVLDNSVHTVRVESLNVPGCVRIKRVTVNGIETSATFKV